MKAVYFLEKNKVKYYKRDTFWSKSKKIENAKIHSDSVYDQERFFESALYSLKNCKGKEEIINFYEGCIYGYQTFKEDQLQTKLSLKKDSEISETVYLKMIKNIQKDGKFETINYKQILRDEKIDKIMEK